MKKKILIADDEKNMIWAMKNALKNENYDIITANDGLEAIELVKETLPNLVLLDLRMPKKNGMEVLKEIKSFDEGMSVIIITAHGSMESAVEAMKIGALDYISKPFDIEKIKIKIEKALDVVNMKEEISYLKETLKNQTGKSIIGKSDSMKKILKLVERVSKNKATVLITGESGTGKELIANAIHYNSDRENKPYIKVNCGAIPENLIESELFGHEKGSFTGAIAKKLGRFERADGGTLFLDEVGELKMSTQVKLLRALQEQEIERVGGTSVIKIDVRIVAATNRNLSKMVDEGHFRADLYYRLNVIPIELPALRMRKEDIPILIDYFLEKYCKELGKEKILMSSDSLEKLIEYEWKGNIRELENVIERLVILCDGIKISKVDLPVEIVKKNELKTEFVLPENGIKLEELEKNIIGQALEKTDYNQTRAAILLGISRHTLIYRMEKYNIRETRKQNER